VKARFFQEFLKCLLLRGRPGFKVTSDAMPQAFVVVAAPASLKQRYLPSPFDDNRDNCMASGDGWRFCARCDIDTAEAGTFSRCRPFSFSVVNCPRRNNVNGIGVHACLLWEQGYRTEGTLVQRSPGQPAFTSHLLPPESRGDLCSQLLKWQRSARYSIGHFQQPDPDIW
jgi:hypothetical protein